MKKNLEHLGDKREMELRKLGLNGDQIDMLDQVVGALKAMQKSTPLTSKFGKLGTQNMGRNAFPWGWRADPTPDEIHAAQVLLMNDAYWQMHPHLRKIVAEGRLRRGPARMGDRIVGAVANALEGGPIPVRPTPKSKFVKVLKVVFGALKWGNIDVKRTVSAMKKEGQ